MVKELLKNYRSKLTLEAAIKALICGLIAGFGASLLFSAFSLLFMLKLYWVSFIIFGGVTAIVFVLAFLKLKPTEKEIAFRIDLLGLEERVLTMNELKGKDDFVSNKQRDDAVKAIKSVDPKLIKIALSIPLIIAFCFVAACSVSMTTITALTAKGVIDLGVDPDDPGGGIIPTQSDEEQVKYFTITYQVEGEGIIQGDVFQVVEEGGNAQPILAVGDDEWGFAFWLEDGSEEPYRMEYEVLEDLVFTAIFKQGNGGNPSPNGQPQEGNEGQEADDDGQQPGDQDNPGEGGKQGNPQPDNPSNAGAGGKYEEINQVIDGETFYGGSVFENATQEMLESLAGSGEFSAEDQEMITDYFNAIKK